MLGTEKCLILCVCTATYSQFKARLHQLFPVVVDTKNLCFAVQKVRHKVAFFYKNLSWKFGDFFQQLSQTKLVEFTSLIDLWEALGRYCCTGLYSHNKSANFSPPVEGGHCMCSSHQKYPMPRTSRNTVRPNEYHWQIYDSGYGVDSQKVFHEAGFDAYCVGFGEYVLPTTERNSFFFFILFFLM